jgi:hypothetical protein
MQKCKQAQRGFSFASALFYGLLASILSRKQREDVPRSVRGNMGAWDPGARNTISDTSCI